MPGIRTLRDGQLKQILIHLGSQLNPQKSIESCMLAAEVPPFKVYQRQSHDLETSLYHYQGLSFMDFEMDKVKKRLTEWGILRNSNC